MAAPSVEDSECIQMTTSPMQEDNDEAMQVSENENNKIKLTDLKVAELRLELEKRDLDKSGVKSVLIERLKTALLEEGKDIDEFTFIISNNKNSLKKKEIPDSETNGGLDNGEHESIEYKDTDSNMDDKASNEVTLLISIDEEEAQLNEDENLELSKVSDSENDKINESNQLNCKSKVKENTSKELTSVEATSSRLSRVVNDETKEKKNLKTPIQVKTSETLSIVSPKVLQVIGKSDKVKSANVLAKSLWVTGLPNTTRAADLKVLFSKEGRVLSVKIVKSAKQTPGKCYGFVTMATSKDATKAIQNLHRTELNGRIISVERTQSEPSALLKKSESKVITLTAKKPPVKKDVAKVSESVKQSSITEVKTSSKPETKLSEVKSSAEVKTKEIKAKSIEKAKSKEKDPKSREHKERDVRRPPIRRPPPQTYHPRSYTFNDKPRYGTFRRPFGSRPFGGRSGFSSTSFRPRSDVTLYDKMREERIRRERYRERERREADRRRAAEISHHKYIERKHREEAFRLEREKERLRIEREMLEREKAEMLKLEREKQRLERERLEREKEELRRQSELRRSTKRPFSHTSRETESYWDERKKVPRYEERSSFHVEKVRLESPSSSRYEYVPRERNPSHRHGFERHSERFSTPKILHAVPRSDFGDRDSRREVTIRSREERPVFDRSEFRDRDNRRSFPSRERHSSRRDSSREDWKHDRRVQERIVASSTSSSQRRMTYY